MATTFGGNYMVQPYFQGFRYLEEIKDNGSLDEAIIYSTKIK